MTKIFGRYNYDLDTQGIFGGIDYNTIAQQPTSYVIYKVGDTIIARPAPGSGLPLYKDTDISKVIQSIIDVLTNGGVIFIRQGYYVYNQPIILSRNNITLIGEGGYIFNPPTILEYQGTGYAIQKDPNIDSLYGITLRNLYIKTVSNGIDISNSAHVVVEDCILEGNNTGIGINFGGKAHEGIEFNRVKIWKFDTGFNIAGSFDTAILKLCIVESCNVGLKNISKEPAYNLKLISFKTTIVKQAFYTALDSPLKNASIHAFLEARLSYMTTPFVVLVGSGELRLTYAIFDDTNNVWLKLDDILANIGNYLGLSGGWDRRLYTPYEEPNVDFELYNSKDYFGFRDTVGGRGFILQQVYPTSKIFFSISNNGNVNLAGDLVARQKGVNVLVPANSTSIDISLPLTEPDTNYGVLVIPHWNTNIWVTGKTTTGFTINFGTAPTVDSSLDWFVFR